MLSAPPRYRWAAAAVALTALAGLGLARWLIQPRGARYAYCAECAARQQTQSWGIRATGVTLYRRGEEQPTAVSTVLTQKRLVGPHVHRWLEPCVVANPLSPYGPPVTLSLGFLNTPLVAALLANLGDFADPVSAQNVRELVLRPEYSYLVNHSLRFHRFPPRGFRDRAQFLSWWTQHGFSFYAHLREETEPD